MSDWRLINADVLAGLASLPDNSVHTVVTSPPYYGLRSYGTERWEGGSADCDHKAHVRPRASRGRGALSGGLDYIEAQNDGSNAYKGTCGKCGAHRIDQQIGLEATPTEFVATMVRVFAEVKRVLRPDGTLFLNLGDSYVGAMSEHRNNGSFGNTSVIAKKTQLGVPRGGRVERGAQMRKSGLKPKDLMMMPARVALALQDDGWWLRSDIIWCKRAPMPESVTDRPTSAHEHIFLLTKSAGYYYDADAVREPYNEASLARYSYQFGKGPAAVVAKSPAVGDGNGHNATPNEGGRNLWNYWLLSPEPYAEAHFATFPTEIPRRAILAGTSERGCCAECGAPWRRVVEKWGGKWEELKANGAPMRWGIQDNGLAARNAVHVGGSTSTTTGWQAACKHDAPIQPCLVLDPFAGAGTTLLVASRLGRRSIGIELSPEYCRMAEKRIESDPASMNMRMELIEATA